MSWRRPPLLGCALAAWAAALAAPAPACAQDLRPQQARPIYLGELRKRAPRLARALRGLDEGSSPTQLQRGLDALWEARISDALIEVPRAEPGGEGAEGSGGGRTAGDLRYQGVRAWLEGIAHRSAAKPESGLRAEQVRLGAQALRSQDPPGPEELMARFPLSPQALEAAARLWSRAAARADAPAQAELRAWARRWHPESPPWPAAPAAKRPPVTDKPRPQGRLELVQVQLLEPGAAQGGPSVPCLPAKLGARVLVSDGARIYSFDEGGGSLGAFPVVSEAASPGPEETTPFSARIADAGSCAFTSLLLDGPLAPARRARQADGSFGGRYFSLVAFDAARGRLLWWDGDPGPGQDALAVQGGAPAGWGESPLLEQLRGAHTLGVCAGPARVYVAFTRQAQDPEVLVMAFSREPDPEGRGLALRPAWPQPAHLLTAERTRGDAGDPLLAPEVSAALSLDPRAGLIVTTDVGVIASLSPTSGEVRWLSHFAPGLGLLSLPAEPALLTEEGASLVYLQRGRVLSLECAGGALRWSRSLGAGTTPAAHLLRWDAEVLVSGGPELWWLEAQGGRVTASAQLGLQGRSVGRVARLGDALLIPNWVQGPRSAVLVYSRATKQIVQRVELGGVSGPSNLAAWGEVAVLASARRVAFLRWRVLRPGER